MHLFDVVKNLSDQSRNIPYLFVLQTDFLEVADTVVAAPLMHDPKLKQLPTRLAPVIVVAGKKYHCVMHQLAAVSRQSIGKTVANAAGQREAIVRAYDVVIAGV